MDPFSIIVLVCTGVICLALGILIGINIRIDLDQREPWCTCKGDHECEGHRA